MQQLNLIGIVGFSTSQPYLATLQINFGDKLTQSKWYMFTFVFIDIDVLQARLFHCQVMIAFVIIYSRLRITIIDRFTLRCNWCKFLINHIYIYICIYIYVCMYVYIYIYLCVYMYIANRYYHLRHFIHSDKFLFHDHLKGQNTYKPLHLCILRT